MINSLFPPQFQHYIIINSGDKLVFITNYLDHGSFNHVFYHGDRKILIIYNYNIRMMRFGGVMGAIALYLLY